MAACGRQPPAPVTAPKLGCPGALTSLEGIGADSSSLAPCPPTWSARPLLSLALGVVTVSSLLAKEGSPKGGRGGSWNEGGRCP